MPEPKVSSSSSDKRIDVNGHSYAVGDLIDARDTVEHWYNSVIRDINLEEERVFVHYLGWARVWDAWLYVHAGTDNIAPLNSKCDNSRGTLPEKEFDLVEPIAK